MNKYIPGVCNIGKQEEELRRKSGVVGLILSILYLIIIISFQLPNIYKLLLFFPLFLTIVSFLQVKMHFCAEFGILGKYNFSDKVGNATSVEELEFINKDKIKALKILLYSFTISIVITLIVTILM